MRLRTGTAVVVLCVLGATSPARAQIASLPPSEGAVQGWSFAVTPYVWLPAISSTLQAQGPRGGTVNTTIDAGIGDYLTDVNFGMMIGGAARYARFSAMTDIVYLNASLTTDVSHLSSVNLGPGPVNVPRSQQLDTGTRMATTIWSLAGTYTVFDGGWGNVDAVGGMRMLAISSTTNYTLGADIVAPDRTIALSRNGNLSIDKIYANAIGGVTGRLNIPNSRFYLPFYLDAGGGAVPFTWQAYGGVAYKAANWADISVGYRYLTFQGGNRDVRNLSLSGVIMAANFHF